MTVKTQGKMLIFMGLATLVGVMVYAVVHAYYNHTLGNIFGMGVSVIG